MINSRFAFALSLVALSVPVHSSFAQAQPLTPPQVLGAAGTIQFTATESLGGVPMTVSTATLVQPNKAFVQDTDAKKKTVSTTYVSDGKLQTEYNQSKNRYTKTKVPADFQDVTSRTLAFAAFSDFYDPKLFAKFRHTAADNPGVYQMLLGTQDGKTMTEVMVVNPATGLPRQVSIVITPSRRTDRPAEQIFFTNWKLNAPVDDGKFAYTPPADAKLYVAPQLLTNGTIAPDFAVYDKDGKVVKLSDYKGKTVVLDFWATWCGPCQESLPHTTEIAKKYADKNAVFLAVNVWDTPAAFQAWLLKHPEYAPLHFAIDPSPDQSKSVASALYGVSGIPTQYVIGADGKIVAGIVGYDTGDTRLEDVLKKTAFSQPVLSGKP